MQGVFVSIPRRSKVRSILTNIAIWLGIITTAAHCNSSCSYGRCTCVHVTICTYVAAQPHGLEQRNSLQLQRDLIVFVNYNDTNWVII